MSEHDVPPASLSGDALEAAIAAQRAAISAFEQEFVPMRKRYERLRARLRELEAERERRRLAEAGQQESFRPIPRRSVTVADAVAGREKGLDMEAPLGQFAFSSVRRQPLILHPDGDVAQQRLTFYRQPGPEVAEAATFGAAKRLLDGGWTPGVPGVALNRMAVYYPETATAGWLRLDQIYLDDGA